MLHRATAIRFLTFIILFTGDTKQTAEGVTRDVRQIMTHELYKHVLMGGETVRLLNTRNASSKHQLLTVITNKKSLSGHGKRYFCQHKITALPFAHCLKGRLLATHSGVRAMRVTTKCWHSVPWSKPSVYSVHSRIRASGVLVS